MRAGYGGALNGALLVHLQSDVNRLIVAGLNYDGWVHLLILLSLMDFGWHFDRALRLLGSQTAAITAFHLDGRTGS